jgi:hypothetical protein
MLASFVIPPYKKYYRRFPLACEDSSLLPPKVTTCHGIFVFDDVASAHGFYFIFSLFIL